MDQKPKSYCVTVTGFLGSAIIIAVLYHFYDSNKNIFISISPAGEKF